MKRKRIMLTALALVLLALAGCGAVQKEQEGFRAYGTPWRGKENMGCNASVPLKALFFLNRSDTPSVVPADHGQMMIYTSSSVCLRPPDFPSVST